MSKNHIRTKAPYRAKQMAQLDQRAMPPPRKHALYAVALQVVLQRRELCMRRQQRSHAHRHALGTLVEREILGQDFGSRQPRRKDQMKNTHHDVLAVNVRNSIHAAAQPRPSVMDQAMPVTPHQWTAGGALNSSTTT